MASSALRDRRILIVEDEYLIAATLSDALEAAGSVVLGPVPSVAKAYGEVLDAFYVARRAGLRHHRRDLGVWNRALVLHLEKIWREPDEGIWEVRGGRRHFTHSKVMAWVAFDRAVRSIEEFGLDGPLERWRDPRRNS